MDISRELFMEHGWKMPPGLMRSEARDPNNFTLAQWQQAQRNGKDPREIKRALQECWAVSDTKSAFSNALYERGYTLAKGDRRSFVAVDFLGEVHSIAKWTNQTARDVRGKLGEPDELPTVDEAKLLWRDQHHQRLSELRSQHAEKVRARFALIDKEKGKLNNSHKAERQALSRKQEAQQRETLMQNQARFRKGLLGLFDRISGKRKRLEKEIESQKYLQVKVHQSERDNLIFRQLDEKQRLYERAKRLLAFTREQRRQHSLEFRELRARFASEAENKPRRKRGPRPDR